MRGSLSGAYVRKTGDTMTGALTISANVGLLLSLQRPDGAAHVAIESRRVGQSAYRLQHAGAQPFFAVSDDVDVTRLSLRTDTGLLGSGLIPLSMLRVDEQTAANAGVVTILAGDTGIVTLASMTVAVGDRIFYRGYHRALKGAVAGNTNASVGISAGTAILAEPLANIGTRLESNHVNATTEVRHVSGIFRVIGAGTCTLSLFGQSAGSNSTVAIGDGNIHALVLRG